MDSAQTRLQTATKIHFFLLRELGEGIDVEKMLKSERYARDVLLVCDACKGSDLPRLAQQFRGSMPPAARQASNGLHAHPTGWGGDSSLFPPSEAAPLAARAAKPRLSWFARLMAR